MILFYSQILRHLLTILYELDMGRLVGHEETNYGRYDNVRRTSAVD